MIKTMPIEQYSVCFDQSQVQHDNIDTVSGVDVRLPLVKGSVYDHEMDGQNCSDRYRYYCREETQEIPEYLKGWKEVVKLQAFKAIVVRMRWTRTDMTEE